MINIVDDNQLTDYCFSTTTVRQMKVKFNQWLVVQEK